MNCTEVKNLLFQYIEKDLDKASSDAVKKHLSECRECKKEYLLIAEYKDKMSSVKSVKAPRDFMIKLNERLEKRSFLQRACRALFYPLKIKIPIEAAGFAAAVLIIVFFYPSTKSINDLSSVKGSFAKMEYSADFEKKPSPIASGAAKDIKIASVKKKAVRDIKTVYNIALLTHPVNRLSAGVSMQKAAMPEEGVSSDKLYSYAPASKAAKEKKDESFRTERKAASEAEIMDNSIPEKIPSPVVKNTTLQDIKKIAAGLNGTVNIKAGIIHVELPSANARNFMDRLASLGSISSDYKKDAKSASVIFQIKIIDK